MLAFCGLKFEQKHVIYRFHAKLNLVCVIRVKRIKRRLGLLIINSNSVSNYILNSVAMGLITKHYFNLPAGA